MHKHVLQHYDYLSFEILPYGILVLLLGRCESIPFVLVDDLHHLLACQR